MSKRLEREAAALIFSALAQETRLEAYRLLVRYQPFGLSAGDISRLIAVPHNTLSTHLSILNTAGLVRSRRQGRSIIFSAVPDQLAAAQRFLLLGVDPEAKPSSTAKEWPDYPIKRPSASEETASYNVLVLCTGNSARSIMAEAILQREGQGLFKAFSAGSTPRTAVDPDAVALLESLGYETGSLRSKSWSEFAAAGAPRMDFVITVCDRAAGETCPVWPGHPLSVHWGIPDPVAANGAGSQKRAACLDAYRHLVARMTAFVNLPIEEMGLSDLRVRLGEIATMDGATELALKSAAA